MPYIATVKTVRTGVARVAVDTCEGLRVRYIGSQASGTVQTSATTCDLLFKQGPLGSETNVIGENPTVPYGGTEGTIDMSEAAVDTIAKLISAINASPDWEAWAVDLPGDVATEISAGTGIFPTRAATQAKVAAGIAFVLVTSLLTAEEHYAGITFNGPSNTPHPHDANTEHLLLEIRALATYAADTVYLSVLACDDVLGTSVVIWGPIKSAATTVEKVVNLGGVPITGTDGLRLVVKMYNDTSAFHATEPLQLVLARESIVKGPALRASHMYARLSI